MRNFKLLIAVVLTLTMLVPMASTAAQFGDYQVFPNDPIEAGYVEPVLDGVIGTDEGWSEPLNIYAEPINVLDPTYRSEKTTAVNFASTSPDAGIDAKMYLGYDLEYFYFAAQIDKFGLESQYLACPSNLDAEKGFNGDVFMLSLDLLSILSEDSANYSNVAPRYFVAYDSEGNGALYHDSSAENLYKNSAGKESLFADFDLKANRLSDEEATVKVTKNDEGDWNFEARISFNVLINDIFDNAGIKATDDDFLLTYIDILLSNKDWKASVTYKYSGFDVEGVKYYTSAIYSTVNDSSLTGVPGQDTDGISVETYGLTFYLCHEHGQLGIGVESEEDFATFEKNGKRSYYCLECGQLVKTEDVSKIPFTDVSAGTWYEDALIRCYNFEYFKGTSATTFAPNMAMTRGMFVQVLANWMGVDTSAYSCNFTDVKTTDWYYGAVAWAYETGVTKGTSDTTFSPNAAITREQAATFFMNFTKAMELYNAPTITEFKGYVDASSVSDWAKDGMLWAVENGVISSTSKDELKLSPQTTANRITAAQMLCNYEDWLLALIG
ncbi:MAG: S-layer homology domain-containing protein [Clostridia bacterium]|nr:S-layer homology domain-containing protein [Clostridia bacterium]